jgi:chemotaxis protein CheX
MTPDDEDVRALTADACQLVFGLEARPVAGALAAPGGEYLRGRIVVTGAWEGAVTLACTHAFARRAAERIFEGAGGVTSPEDVRDALGELTNIIGGGVKGLMPSPSRLSLPTVTRAEGWRGGAAAGVARELWFTCSGEHFVVTVAADRAAQDQGTKS